MRITIDSADYPAIAGYRWPHKIGYYNGPGAWTREQIAEAARAGELLALVDVEGTAPYAASILDWESGKIQNPDLLRDWVMARNLFRGDAAIYCSREQLTAVINALQGEPCRIWLAEPSGNHEPPRQPPPLGLPANLTLLGIKYAAPPDSGGDYDISVLYDDAWHNTEDEDLAEVAAGEIDPATGDGPLGMAAAAAPLTDGEQNLANLEAYWARQADPGKAPAASATASIAAAAAPAAPAALASSPTLPTGQNMANPEASPPSPPGPGSPPAAGSPGSAGISPLPPRPVPAAALSRQSDDASAPSSSSPGRPSTQPSDFSIPPGLLQQPGPIAGPAAPAQPAPATSPSAGTGVLAAAAIASEFGHEPGDGPPATSAIPAPAGGSPASQPLPHKLIGEVIQDMRGVARLFHGAGAHHVGRQLEEAASVAAELGQLLLRAGL